MLKKLFAMTYLISAFTSTALAWQIQKNADSNWLDAQQAKPSVYQEMNKYFVEIELPTQAIPYTQYFIKFMHQKIVTETTNSLKAKLSQASCIPSSSVSFPETLTLKHNFEAKIGFEKEIVKTQSYDCLGKLNLDKVFFTFMSEKFQSQAIKDLDYIHINESTNTVCHKVSIFMFGQTHFCFTQNVLANEKQYIVHSFNEKNIGDPKARVYYRESVSVFTQLPDGEVSLYNLAYGRGPDLPFHGVVEKLVKNQQEFFIQKLIESAK